MDPLDDLRDPGLSALFRGLTSDPTTIELAGEQEALAMFRSAYPQPARSKSQRWRWRLGPRLGAAGAVVAVFGGVTAAAYAQALPPPVQHVVHQVFGFAGVPNSPPQIAHASASPHGHRHGKGSGPGGHGHHSSAPQPGSSGKPSHSPGPRSRGHHHSKSGKPSVPPGKPSVSLKSGSGKYLYLLVVTVPHGQRGEKVELQKLENGTWVDVQSHPLGKDGRTEFEVSASKIGVTYQVVLGKLVSNPVTVPARSHGKGNGNHGPGR